jgi:hypothetical protein
MSGAIEKTASVFLCWTLLLSCLAASAEGLSTYSIQPMETAIKLEDRQTQNFVLTNHSQDTIAVSLEVFERFSKNGTEYRSKTMDLAFDKSKLELGPGQSVNVIGEYRGKKNLEVERSFRVVTTQLSSTGDVPGLRFSHEASVFFSLKNMSPDIRVKIRSQVAPGSIEVELDNRGRAHQALSEIAFIVFDSKNSGKEKPLELDSLTRELLGKLILLPRSKRRMTLQLASSSVPVSGASLISARPIR